ncbi:MAG: META domain-containing protein [Spirochaetaceae bacterium]|nr:META domain-containing protein [Spirochaetaceae bacterium]
MSVPREQFESVQPQIKESANKDPFFGRFDITLDDLKNIVWKLSEIKIGYGSILLDRALMAKNQMGDFFTLQFVDEGINGKALPNRYFAPYLLVDDNDITIRPIAGTLIASLVDVGVLHEQRYFTLLQGMTRWDYKSGNLRIYTSGERENNEIILIFKPQ